MEFVVPEECLIGGFDIHVYFPIEKLEMASSFYKNFLTYLSNNGITPTFSSFSEKTEGPHIGPNFTIQLMGINPNRDIQQEGGAPRAIFCIGYAYAFVHLNRPADTRFRIFVHPNVAKPFGDVAEEIIDHTKRGSWLSDDAPPPCLSVEFFEMLLKQEQMKTRKDAGKRSKATSSAGLRAMQAKGKHFLQTLFQYKLTL